MEEQWKVYKKTKLTLWEISDMGNVKKNGQPYICGKSNSGYYFFSNVFLHRAVAELFVPNTDPVHKTYVDHIDGNRLNNKASNLQWVTCKENCNNPITLKRLSESNKGIQAGEKHPMYGKHPSEETRKKMRNAKTLKPVICLKNDQIIKIYEAMQDVRKDGFHVQHVCDCCKGRYKSHKGFNWMYLSDEKRQG